MIIELKINASGRGHVLLYIDQSINYGPLDQTDLKEQLRCNLEGGREPTFEARADMRGQRAAGLQVGSAGPTYHPLTVCFGEMASSDL
jgi:hypothetical protein